MDDRDGYYCCLSSHGSECNSPVRSNMCYYSYDTITMDNSHNPKNDDSQASVVYLDVDSSVHENCIMVYK